MLVGKLRISGTSTHTARAGNVIEGSPRILGTRRIYKMAKAVLQVEQFFQRHVQKAVKLAQHLLRPLPKRNSLRRQVDKHASFIGGLPASANQALAFQPFEHWRKSAKIHS